MTFRRLSTLAAIQRVVIGQNLPISRCIRLRSKDESSHQIRMGDTGVGKSSLTRQDLIHARAYDIPCVVNDPECEFVQEFYDESLGDFLLNPTDDRVPYWDIRDEFHDAPTAKSVIRSLLPGSTINNATSDIFNTWVWDLGEFLLSQYRPDTATFSDWLSDFREIERRVKGTNLEQTLNKNAAGQHSGIVGHFGNAAAPLSMMPREQGDRRKFSVIEW